MKGGKAKKLAKGKRITLLSVISGLVLLIVLGILSKNVAVEYWYIHRLRKSPWLEERKHAADTLAEMRSARAVPYLMEIIKDDEELQPSQLHSYWGLNGLHGKQWERLWPGEALARIGKSAILALLAALNDEEEFVRERQITVCACFAGCHPDPIRSRRHGGTRRRMVASRGKIITLLSAAGVFGLVITGLFYREELLARYHLYKLNNSPKYFLEILERPEETPERKAVRLFLRSEKGKEALFREYADVLTKSVFPSMLTRNVDVAGTVIDGFFWAGEEKASYVQWGPPATFGSFGLSVSFESAGRWRATRDLLEMLADSDFAIPEYPDLRFTIARVGRVLEASPVLGRQGFIFPASRELGCRITRKPELAVTAATPLLNHSNFTIRQEAALLLGSLGPREKGAISALKELLKRRRFQRKPDGSIDYRVQKAAEDALEKTDI